MQNILIITQALTGGGAEKLAANLSLELSKTYNVTIVTYKQDNSEYDFAGDRININRVGGRGGFFTKVINAIGRVYDVRRIKKRIDCDCSISFIPQTDYVNILSRRKHEKTIIDVVSNMSFVYPKGIKKWFRKYILNKANFIVTVSEGVRADLIENFGISASQSKTIYNSCNIAAIQKDCNDLTEYRKMEENLPKKYICSMGSFRLAKGHWHLIKAFAYVKDRIPDYKLVILGDGQYRDKYKALIENLGIVDRVVMPGFANPPFSIISKSSLFVFSSVFEGFGNSIIEAMACRVPVLSTDFDYGAREILAPNTCFKDKAETFEECEYGFLLPPFNKEDIDCTKEILELEKLMGESMVKVLERDNTALINKGIKYVEKFDNSFYGENWESLMEERINE